MPEPTAVPGGVERSPSGAPPLGLPPRPARYQALAGPPSGASWTRNGAI
ncbi:hypothetical protein SEA_SPIKEBT_4 [Mycobacterium phage SpikeBT]|uniref:Uncharacterized protein n=1 Tax=Mycobacterium phage Hermia TaxID=3136620 RepID=A0AAU8GLX2_9VIRU|nr:hypothetical protein PBI_PINTO_4 [Mycobacterium phage Pinto]AHZ95084.1 hypothetical protein PBI_PINTO_4 [Mycobacterium phage Pinto]AVP41766.1 hypothetical protein PBI_GAGEAP_5 [Mycobacterium phage GageAP]QAY03788.1 hypothetical protein SEA_AFIS_4 [Mycobacterium phage AFIS]QAY04386.1 hypothetical protein SEA_SPIKEBT_4 [Mycobacterium phage SpikeBT]